MTREIKFRAWDKNLERMYFGGDHEKQGHGFLLNFSGDLISDYDKGDNLHAQVFARCGYDLQLMQYTGLKDRHGNEIYEGDIVQSVTKRFSLDRKPDENYESINKAIIKIGKYEIECCGCCYKSHSAYGVYVDNFNSGEKGNGINEDEVEINDCEVIGNIYESELLTNEKD